MTDKEIIKAWEKAYEKERIDGVVCRGYYLDSAAMDETIALINRLQAEIERFADIGKMYSEIRAEAVKEFAERLKMLNNSNLFIWNEQIDNLVKEMVGEG